MWLLRLLCALLLAGILAAGLWPFLPPKNQVSWAGNRNGIRFAGQGIIYASGPRPGSRPPETDSCAVEIWLEPEAAPGRGVLVGFHSAGYSFALFQERFALGLQLHNHGDFGLHYSRRVKDVFHPGQPVLIAVSSNGRTANIFVDGVLTQSVDFPLVAGDLYGEFQSRDWEGRLFGMATYERALSPADVSRHRDAWTSDGRPERSPGAEMLAMYLFDERGGRVIHNRAGGGPDLYMPARYREPNRVLLKTDHPHLSEWRDTLVNIAGFVPLGFLFYAYFSLRRSPAFPALVTVLTGFFISLAIEVGQSFLPGRISDLVDIVTNTLGTVAGVLLYRIARVSSGLAKLVFIGPTRPPASEPMSAAQKVHTPAARSSPTPGRR